MSDAKPVPPEMTEELPAASPSMVGRKDDMDMLLMRLQQTHEGRGGVIGIRADSGMGKTNMVRDLAARAASKHVKAVLVACRGSLQRAYYPMGGLVRTLLEIAPEEHSREQLDALDRALARLGIKDDHHSLAGLLNVMPLEGTGPLVGAVVEREEHADEGHTEAPSLVDLADVLSRVIAEISKREGGLCLIFDDLDEAHPTTISLFQKLVEKPTELSALFVGCLAPSLSDEFQAIFGDQLKTLNNLSQEETLELGRSVAGAKRLAPDLADMLWKRTEGDPLFITLMMQDLLAAGHVKISRGEASLSDEDIPATLVQLITARADALSKSQRETLDCAAVLGDGFRMGALSALRGRVPAAELEADLDVLTQKEWLDRAGKGRQVSHTFTQRIKRNIIYNALPSDRRATLHKSAGDYYAVVTAGNKIRVENAMYHYVRSGDISRALPVIEIAITKARAAGEREQLAALYKMGVEVAASDSSLSTKQIEMAERLGDLYAASGDYAQAAEMYTKYSPPVTSPAVLGKLGLATLAVDPGRAASVLSRSLAVAGSSREEDARWVLEASLCWALSISNNSYEAIRRCRDALGKLGDTVGFGEARTLMRAMLGMILFYGGDIQEASPHLESARAGWGARGKQEGVMLINQVLISMPKSDITRLWIKMLLLPMVKA